MKELQKRNDLFSGFIDGLFAGNPVLVCGLALCPAVMMSATMKQALVLCAATAAVMILSVLIASLAGRFIPEKYRIFAYLILTSLLTAVTHLALGQIVPSVTASMGIYLPLVAFDSMILSFVTSGKVSKGPLLALVAAVGEIGGFSVVLIVMSVIRELFGTGFLLGRRVLSRAYSPMAILTTPAGGFLLLGLLAALTKIILSRTGLSKNGGHGITEEEYETVDEAVDLEIGGNE